jgi:hypothetical protein
MKLKLECGRICIVPETVSEGLHLGAFYGQLPEQARDSVWMKDGEYIACDYVQLRIVDDFLDWKGKDLGRVERIEQLLEAEKQLKDIRSHE